MTFPFIIRRISLIFTKSKHLRVSIAVVELLRTTTQTDAPTVEAVVSATTDFLSIQGGQINPTFKSFLLRNKKNNCSINLQNATMSISRA